MKELTMVQAKSLTGGLGHSSKMPCPTYGISAYRCQTGSKLAKIPGTPCHECYAMHGNYQYPNVLQAHENRWQSWENKQWVRAMMKLILKSGSSYFRWFDSGDIQGLPMLKKIVTLAKNMPYIKFWLPTQERGLLKYYTEMGGKIPKNLIIRKSAVKIDTPLFQDTPGSVVLTEKTWEYYRNQENPDIFPCPSSTQNNECQDCRACWDPKVKMIGYKYH